MILPQPPVPLQHACSVVYNHTLYSYSSRAFQSLPFTAGASWKTLPTGVSVEGAVCVGTTPPNTEDAAFYVIGGQSNQPQYSGIQRYSYMTGKWESMDLTTPITDSRKGHGAVYINVTHSILVYGGANTRPKTGSQKPSSLSSSQTFTIDISNDHEVRAWKADAPPAVSPTLLPWSESEIAYIGGSRDNTKVMLFNARTGWTDSGATLSQPVAEDLSATIATGPDGSKHLVTYDLTKSPNIVQWMPLVDSTGKPVKNSAPIQPRSGNSNGGGSETSHGDENSFKPAPKGFPLPYDGSLAPKTTRAGYSVAQDSTGLVIFVGGASENVVSVFEPARNRWMSAESLFGSKSPGKGGEGAHDPKPGDHGPKDGGGGNHGGNVPHDTPTSQPHEVLAAVFGASCGVAFVILVMLLLIRKRQQNMAKSEAERELQLKRHPSLSRSDIEQLEAQKVKETRGSVARVSMYFDKMMGKSPRLDLPPSRSTMLAFPIDEKPRSSISKAPLPETPTAPKAPPTRMTLLYPIPSTPVEPPLISNKTLSQQSPTRVSMGTVGNKHWSSEGGRHSIYDYYTKSNDNGRSSGHNQQNSSAPRQPAPLNTRAPIPSTKQQETKTRGSSALVRELRPPSSERGVTVPLPSLLTAVSDMGSRSSALSSTTNPSFTAAANGTLGEDKSASCGHGTGQKNYNRYHPRAVNSIGSASVYSSGISNVTYDEWEHHPQSHSGMPSAGKFSHEKGHGSYRTAPPPYGDGSTLPHA